MPAHAFPSASERDHCHESLFALQELQHALTRFAQPTPKRRLAPVAECLGEVLAEAPLTVPNAHWGVGEPLDLGHVAAARHAGVGALQVYGRIRIGILTTSPTGCGRTATRPARDKVASAVLAAAVAGLGAQAMEVTCQPQQLETEMHRLANHCDMLLLPGLLPVARQESLARSRGADGRGISTVNAAHRAGGRVQVFHGDLLGVSVSSEIDAALSAFILFAAPIVRRLQGYLQPVPHGRMARLVGANKMPGDGMLQVQELPGDCSAQRRVRPSPGCNLWQRLLVADGLAWQAADTARGWNALVAFHPLSCRGR